MGAHIDPTSAAATSVQLRAAGRVVVRGLGVTFVLLCISALPGPIPATVRDAATEGTRQPMPAYEVIRVELVASDDRQPAAAASAEIAAPPSHAAGATR